MSQELHADVCKLVSEICSVPQLWSCAISSLVNLSKLKKLLHTEMNVSSKSI